MKTGAPDLDLILGGGLEPGSIVVVAGAPGTGKTILAQQISFANATPERKALYYTTLSEPHSKLVRHLEQFDFFDPSGLGERVEFLHLGELVQEQGSDGLPAAIEELSRVAFEESPSVVVVDSAKALRDFVGEHELRKIYYQLASRVSHTSSVLLLLGEYSAEEIGSSPEFSLADGILELAFEAREPLDRRWLRVHKLRGGEHLVGKHSYRIRDTGIEVYPRLETLSHGWEGNNANRIVSGIPGLDEIMGGGLAAEDATVLLGPSGSGKTILSLAYLRQGLEEGARTLYVSFQETPSQLVRKAANFGWDLASPYKSGQFIIHHVPVEALDLDILGAVVRQELASSSPRRIVIDSLAELVLAARESERFPAFARSLVGLIRAHSGSLIVTSETSTLGPMAEPVGGLSFLFNNVILLRYIEKESELQRAINILKMRDSDHAKGVFQLLIDSQGISVGEKLSAATGVLGWSALQSS